MRAWGPRALYADPQVLPDLHRMTSLGFQLLVPLRAEAPTRITIYTDGTGGSKGSDGDC